MKNYTILFLLFAIIATSCTKDNGQYLFEMFYPNNLFEIPAGVGGAFPREVEWSRVQTNIDLYSSQAGVDTSVITNISPTSATISSLDDNLDFFFVQEVSIRICPTSQQDCQPADEVFYIDRLNGEAGETIRLLPTLRNVRKQMLGKEFKLEALFFLNSTTPYRMDAKLDMNFEAFQ